MSYSDLNQKHTFQRETLIQQQRAERDQLQAEVDEQAQAIAAEVVSISRRFKEQELARLNQRLADMAVGHAAALNKLDYSQESERRWEEARQAELVLLPQLDPMVREVLEEAARLMQVHLVQERTVSHTTDRTVGSWIFKRVVREQRYVAEETRSPSKTLRIATNEWAIEGAAPPGCKVKLTVSLQGRQFRVRAESDTGRITYSSVEEGSSHSFRTDPDFRPPTNPRFRVTHDLSHMRPHIEIQTRDVTREALVDALVSMMDKTPIGVPGDIRIEDTYVDKSGW